MTQFGDTMRQLALDMLDQFGIPATYEEQRTADYDPTTQTVVLDANNVSHSITSTPVLKYEDSRTPEGAGSLPDPHFTVTGYVFVAASGSPFVPGGSNGDALVVSGVRYPVISVETLLPDDAPAAWKLLLSNPG